MTIYKDFPFDEICQAADQKVKEGFEVYQKFTCAGCGQRLTIDVPNHFHRTGTCDRCPAVTDIEKQGCNYMLHMRLRE
jgi:hypothetical protein